MRYLAPIPSQFLDENGEPYYGGMVHVYVHGEMRHAEIYQNAQTDELAQNPFPLDSHGSWQAFVDADKTFDYIVKDSGGNVVARFPEITFPTGEGVPEVSVVSPEGSINVNEVVDETGKTFKIEVNRDILEPSYSEFSHDTVNGNGGAAVLDSFTLEIDADADIYLTEGVLTFKKGLYHVSMNLVIGNSVESGAYYDIVVNFGGNELKKTWDGSFVHEESVELGMDVTADQDGHTVIPSIVELPEGMYCRVSRLDVHKVGGAGVGGSGAPIEHDGSLEGDGTHGNPLGVKDYSEIRTDLAEVIEGLDTHKTDPSAHQDIRDELERKEDKDNKVTSWGGTPSDEKYPSEKLVKDTIDNIPPGTAVKGDAESEYRTGNVNLTPANIGAATAAQGANADTAVQGVKVNGTELSKDGNNKVDVPVPTAFAATPLKDGTASAGSSSQWARGDHVHPTDDSREAVNNKKQVVNDSSTTEYPSSKAVADFVNSSVATNTANFLGTISESSLGLDYTATNEQIALALNVHSWESTPTNNDYCFVSVNDPQTTDVDEYRRFKFNGSVWAYEYTLNNSSFTTAQWDAINSGLTSSDRTAYNAAVTLLSAHVGDGSIHVTSSEKNAWNAKQDAISDLATIRSGASAGATALQPSGNGSNLSVTPDGTSTGYDLGSSTTLKAFTQKFKNLVGALKALAFKDKVSDSDISGTISDSHIASASTWNGKQRKYLSVYGNSSKVIKLFRVCKFTAGSSIGTTVELIGRAGGTAVRAVINIKASITADYTQFYDYAGDTSHYFTLYVAQDPDDSSKNLVYASLNGFGSLYLNASDASAGDTDIDFSVFGEVMSGRISGDTAITLRNMKDASWINSGTFDAARIPTSLPNTSIGGSAGAVTSIGEGQSNAARHVWFSDANDETKRVHNSNFTYNPVGNIISANISGNANGSAAYTNFIYDGESAGQRGSGQKVRMYGIDNTNNAYQSWYKVATIAKKSQTNYTSARLVCTLFASGSNWAANINNAIHLQILFNFVTVTHKVYHTPNPNVKSLIRIVEINNNDTYELQIRPQALSNYSNFRLYIWDDQSNNVTISFSSGTMGEAASNGTVLDNYQIDPYYGRLANEAVGNSTTPVYVDSNGQVQVCNPSQMSVGNATKWDGHAISIGSVSSSAGTISIV